MHRAEQVHPMNPKPMPNGTSEGRWRKQTKVKILSYCTSRICFREAKYAAIVTSAGLILTDPTIHRRRRKARTAEKRKCCGGAVGRLEGLRSFEKPQQIYDNFPRSEGNNSLLASIGITKEKTRCPPPRRKILKRKKYKIGRQADQPFPSR